MALATTAIGAFPKPDYVNLPDWFSVMSTMVRDSTMVTSHIEATPELDETVARGITDVVRMQVEAGVDIPTDGEVRRENYVHYHCRHLTGIDFGTLTEKIVRNGTWRTELPTFVGPIAPRTHFLDRDFTIARAATDRPVKMTVPGPMTIMDTTANSFYSSDLEWGEALARALNSEIHVLADAGCTQIQIDEPVFARYPDRAVSYGFDLLELAFAGVPEHLTTTLHICCGYPDRLDNPAYEKADPAAYFALAGRVEASSIDAVSLEDAHRNNPLELFEAFEATAVVLGSVQIASSTVESSAVIAQRAAEVLEATPSRSLMLAPDCGLGLLPATTALAKLSAIRRAADQLP